MNKARIVFVDSWLSFRGGLRILTPVMFLTTIVLAPLAQLLFFVQVGRFAGTQSAGFYVVGNAVYSCAIGSIFMLAASVAFERRHNTLILIDASPVSRVLLFGGRLVPALCLGLCSGIVALVGGLAVTGAWPGASSLAGIGVAMVTGGFSAACFGVTLGAVGLRVRDVNFLGNLTITVFLLLSGADVPVSQLPRPIAPLADLSPMTLGIEAARNAYSGHGAVLAPAVLEILVGLGWLALSAVLYARFAASAHKRASLELS
ncbi:MAG TPA: ABC transporter permease [Actinospica sp.]|jgi:ABC-2 type transport system permease protein|nr:ABC transporter permease [Actinospica sp.]